MNSGRPPEFSVTWISQILQEDPVGTDPLVTPVVSIQLLKSGFTTFITLKLR